MKQTMVDCISRIVAISLKRGMDIKSIVKIILKTHKKTQEKNNGSTKDKNTNDSTTNSDQVVSAEGLDDGSDKPAIV
jgi:hypothetical protein